MGKVSTVVVIRGGPLRLVGFSFSMNLSVNTQGLLYQSTTMGSAVCGGRLFGVDPCVKGSLNKT